MVEFVLRVEEKSNIPREPLLDEIVTRSGDFFRWVNRSALVSSYDGRQVNFPSHSNFLLAHLHPEPQSKSPIVCLFNLEDGDYCAGRHHVQDYEHISFGELLRILGCKNYSEYCENWKKLEYSQQ